MGKNHRHKKNLKSEKAKVKLKDRITKTKFLPKGQNITNVEFKVKPIILPEQLKEKDVGLPLSKRKLNVKDLLSRLKHYNENVKLGACEELDVMLKIHTEEILGKHLSELLKTVCNLIQDREKKVRKAAAKVIDTIMRYSNAEGVQPYFPYVMVNLKCAMTHINRNVQEDSLLLLDALLRHVPSLLAKESSNILPDFFSLISRLKSESNMNRTLTVDLGSKIASVKWRVKVLCRLLVLLTAIIGDTDTPSLISVNHKSITWSNTLSHTPIYKNHWVDDNPINVFTMVKCCDNETSGDENRSTLNKYFSSLIPLLHEIWIEALPENCGKLLTDNMVLNEETSMVLSSILRILHMFWRYAEVNKAACSNRHVFQVFSTKDANQFMVDIIRHFPYSEERTQKSKKRSKEINKIIEMCDDPNCTRENLLICYLYLKMNLNNNRNIKTEISTVVEYVTSCLVTRNFVKVNNFSLFNSLLRLILNEHPNKLMKKDLDVANILDNVIHYYRNAKLTNSDRINVFQILIAVTKHPVLSQLPTYHSWLASLPEELLKPEISPTFVTALLDISKKNIDLFHQSLLGRLKDILDNLLKMKVTNTNSLLDDKRYKGDIAYIFFYVPVLDCQHIDVILKFIEAVADPDWKHSFTFMLKERLMFKKSEMTDAITACIEV